MSDLVWFEITYWSRNVVPVIFGYAQDFLHKLNDQIILSSFSFLLCAEEEIRASSEAAEVQRRSWFQGRGWWRGDHCCVGHGPNCCHVFLYPRLAGWGNCGNICHYVTPHTWPTSGGAEQTHTEIIPPAFFLPRNPLKMRLILLRKYSLCERSRKR